ncbi:MAG TPA: M1 family metallopeptidase, partial [Salinimicrobium sp.]|nr:M1 family metallopeptidase [Salinimicrobium sp.]
MKYLFLLFPFFVANGLFSQQTQSVDFKKAAATISIHPENKSVRGEVVYTFEILENVDSIFIDAKDMEFANIELNGKKADFLNDGERLWILSDFQKSTNNTLGFNYKAFPEQSMYFIGWQDSLKTNELSVNQVWTQGQGKETSYWLPSFDNTNEKVEFDLSFNFKKGYEVISNGKLIDKVELNDSIVRWKYDMDHPMSSYLVAVAAGKYDRKEMMSSAGIPIYLYYYPRKKDLVEPTYRYSKRIFDFLVQEIGVPFPWKNYKQIPVRDFLYSGMENTTATIFSDVFITDSIGFKDRNYVMVNAHELAHQWFGDMVTAVSDKHHWLQEGFATYFALLAEKEIFGDDYFYWKLYESAERLKSRSDIGKGEAVLRAGGNSLTYYQKGAWALHILREKIGDEAFKKGIRNYLKKYKYKNVTTRDFISEMEKASGVDLSGFVSKWLEQSVFQAYEALNSLKKSEFITNYLKIAALKELPLEGKKELLSRALDFPMNDYIGQEVVYQLALENPMDVMDLYEKAFATNNIFVRQAIAISMDSIPKELK